MVHPPQMTVNYFSTKIAQYTKYTLFKAYNITIITSFNLQLYSYPQPIPYKYKECAPKAALLLHMVPAVEKGNHELLPRTPAAFQL